MYGKSNMETYITICKIDGQWEFAVCLRELKQGLCINFSSVQFSSVAQSCPTLCDSMNHSMPGLPVHHQLGVHSDLRPSSPWCHPAISSSVVPFSSCPQSLPASEPFPMSQLFAWGGQSTGVSALASFLPKKSQGKYIKKLNNLPAVITNIL